MEITFWCAERVITVRRNERVSRSARWEVVTAVGTKEEKKHPAR